MTHITTFGTEALFIPDNYMRGMPNQCSLSSEIFDLDEIRKRNCRSIRLGTIFGGIESTTDPGFPPVFQPKETEASSRLIDVYLELLE